MLHGLKPTARWSVVCVGLALTALPVVRAGQDSTDDTPAAGNDRRLLDGLRRDARKYCAECHLGDKAEAGFNLEFVFGEKRGDTPEPTPRRLSWLEAVAGVVQRGEMPPDVDAMNPAQRRRMVRLAERQLELWQETVESIAEPVTMRRLSLQDYGRTITALLGVAAPDTSSFPPDDLAFGFDNIGDVLTISPLLLEWYLDAADDVAERVFASDESRALYLASDPGEGDTLVRATAVFQAFLLRAWRRPPQDEAVAQWASFVTRQVDGGRTFESAMRDALAGILVTSRFLFRAETATTAETPLDPWSLASRLSYFLWGEMPDDELFARASDGTLGSDEVLKQQAKRLLESPRSEAFTGAFAWQWLGLRELDAEDLGDHEDATELLADFERETLLLFDSVLRDRRPVLDLLTADYTYLSERLARHYDIPGVEGTEFRRVSIADTHRRGILGQGSVLTVTSYPTRTSPTLRGNWILDVLLDDRESVPMDVPEVEDPAKMETPGSLREVLKVHRQRPDCAVCHDKMDPLGFALDGFDELGRFREEVDGVPVDVSAELPNGEKIIGLDGLLDALADDERLVETLQLRLFIFGIGREPTPSELRELVASAGPAPTLFDLVLGVITAPGFRR